MCAKDLAFEVSAVIRFGIGPEQVESIIVEKEAAGNPEAFGCDYAC